MLAATATDANGSLFPVAFAIVDIENDDNWHWFLQLLHRVIAENSPEFLQGNILTFLSDRQKGLLEAVENIFPGSPHGYCLKHLEENFRRMFKNVELCSLLWKAARATTVEEFNKCLEAMNKIDQRAIPWLQTNADPKHWAELYFEGYRYGHLTSNIAESLNSWLLPAREQPILAMLEAIRHQLMSWFATRRESETNTTGLVVKKAAKRIQDTIQNRTRRYRYISTTDTIYEVNSGIRARVPI